MRRSVITVSAVLAFVVVVGGCAGDAGSTLPPSSSGGAPTAAPASSDPVTAAPSASPAAVTTTKNVAYESANDVLVPGVLDAYAPSSGGPWPVVVMFHGTPWEVSKEFLAEHAERVAQLGFVVFDADWGHTVGSWADLDPYEYAMANDSQVACAVAFARSHAADYGGDPAKVIIFGHSGGSNVGSVVAFGGGQPSRDCLGGDVGTVDALIAYEGNFLLAPEESQMLMADPRVMEAITPWSVLDRRPDMPVFLLLSANPGDQVRGPLPAETVPGYLALRDRDGTLTRLVEKTGVFKDEEISVADMLRVLYEGLREQGNPVSLDIVPGSAHLTLSEAGWRVFLAVFTKAAGRS